MTVHRTRPALLATASLTVLVALAGPAGAGQPASPDGRAASATASARAAAVADPAARAALGRQVSAALSAAGVTTVAAAVDVDGLGAVLRRDAGHALPPASTQKSWTVLSALVGVGPDARFRTEVAATAATVDGHLAGDLWLVAGGDPYLTDAHLRSLAQQVRAGGVDSVSGDLRLDDSRYDARRAGAGWKPSYLPAESGPLSALALDRNRWRRDASFLRDPALPAAVRLRDHLRAAGVTMTGTVRRGARPAAAAPLAVHESPVLSSVVRRALKDSDNFAAELLLKEVGRVVRGDGSTAGGLAASAQVLGRLGVPAGRGSDGSGLSTRNRQSPSGQLALLRAAETSGRSVEFRAALPTGCVDGTLRRRFCGTAAAGRVHAKTGTLSGVRALAGYTTTASGRPVRFAFQLTGVKDGARALRAMDRAVVLLASSGA